MLNELHALPEGILDRDTRGLYVLLGGPTLIHLPGDRQPALFLSVLLHGNETVGWEALRALLRQRWARFGELRLPRALTVFIGNVAAAAVGVRHLPDQPDYNRVWPGSELAPTPEHDLMRQVTERLRARGLFASLDIHNNTGLNPHYVGVNRLDHQTLHLARLFSRTLMYFRRPKGIQAMAMGEFCPAVTLECGKVGDLHGRDHASDTIDACLHLSALPQHPVPPHDIDLFHTVARVEVPEELSFAFPPATGDILFSPDLERFNFRELPRGTAFGRVNKNSGVYLDVRDEQGTDVYRRFFQVEDGELRLSTPVMPSMLTLNTDVIRQDCLCYLMERYNDHVPHRP
jgi:hypothetical protein